MTGRPGAQVSGQEVLFGQGAMSPLFSFKGIAGLGAEMLLDPLNLLGGFGAFSKLGKTIGKLAPQLNRAETVLKATAQGPRQGASALMGLRTAGDDLLKFQDEVLGGADISGLAGKTSDEIRQGVFDILQTQKTPLGDIARQVPQGSPLRIGETAAERAALGQQGAVQLGGEFRPFPLLPKLFDLPEINVTLPGLQGFVGETLGNVGDLPGIRQFRKTAMERAILRAAEKAGGEQFNVQNRIAKASELTANGKHDEAAQVLEGLSPEDALPLDVRKALKKSQGVARMNPKNPTVARDVTAPRSQMSGKLRQAGMKDNVADEMSELMIDEDLSDASIESIHKMVSDGLEGGKTPKQLVRLVTAIKTANRHMFEYENLAIGLESNIAEYATHTLTPGGRKYFQTLSKNREAYQAMRQRVSDAVVAKGGEPLEFGGPTPATGPLPENMKMALEGLGITDEFIENAMHGSAYQRQYRGLTVNELNDIFGEEVFSIDPFHQLTVRSSRHMRVAAQVDFLEGLSATGGKKIPTGLRARQIENGVLELNVPVGTGSGKLYSAPNLRTFDGQQMAFESAEEAARATRAIQAMQSSVKGGELMQWYDQMTRLFKSGLTRPFPAFHIRNRFSNRIQAWMDGVPVMGEHYRIANQVMAGKNITPVRAGDGTLLDLNTLRGEIEAQGITKAGWFEDLATETGDRLKPGILDRLIGGAEKVSAGIANAPGRLASGVNPISNKVTGEAIEGVDRLGTYLHHRMSGLAPDDAAKRTFDSLFDYRRSAQTPFEQEYMQRLFLFYTYARNVVPFMVERAFRDTKKVVPWLRLANQNKDDEHVPTWIREGFSIPLGKDDAGQDRILAGLGTPIEAAAEPFLGFQDGISRGMAKFATSFNPMITAPVELVSGKDLFLGRDIDDLRKAPNFFRFLPETVKDALGIKDIERGGKRIRTEMDPWAAWLLRNSPIARVSNTLSKASDERKDAVDIASNLFTGGVVTTVDPEREARLAKRRGIVKRLRELERAGKVREIENIFGMAEGPEAKGLIKELKGTNKRRAPQASVVPGMAVLPRLP